MLAIVLQFRNVVSTSLVAGGLIVASGVVQDLKAETLEEALVAAYTSNPTLLAGRAYLRSIDEGVPQALSGWRPSLSAAAETGVSEIESSTAADRHQQRRPHVGSLSLSQSLYNGGRVPAAISRAENTVIAERAGLQTIEQSVLLDAVSVYTSVYRAEAILSLNVHNEQVLNRQLEATRDRFEVGEITRTDVHQAEARLARATADRIQAEGDIVAARAAYRNVIGKFPENLVAPTSLQDLPSGVEAAVSIAVDKNPGVISAEYSERAAQDNISGVRGELLPSVNLTGSASKSLNASGESTRVDTYTAKVTLSVPLYQSGSVYSRLRQARHTASRQRRLVEQARRDAIETATQAWESLQTSRARIESFQAQIRAAEVALEGVQREAAVGSRTVLDVLDAEQELLDAKVSIVSAERDEIVARFNLKSAIGELTAKNLSLPVDVYDSENNLGKVRSQWFGGEVENESK